MSSVRGCVCVAACLGVVSIDGAWLGRSVTAAQQPAAAPPADIRGNLDHGRYLVERVAVCGDCHSTRNEAGDIIESTRLRGGPMPARVPWPADWPAQVPPIAGMPGYSDAAAQRLLTQGAIKRNGTQARAPMPRFRMTPQDAADVVAFLRSK